MPRINKFYGLIVLLLLLSTLGFSAVTPTVADSIQRVLNQTTPECSACPITQGPKSNPNVTNLIFVLSILAIGSAGLFVTYKKKIILVGGVLLGALVLGSFLIPTLVKPKPALPGPCALELSQLRAEKIPQAASGVQTPSKSVPKDSVALSDEFTPASDEFAPASDEFSNVGSEFENVSAPPPPPPETFWQTAQKTLARPMVYEPLTILFLIALISFAMRYPRFRKARAIFLLVSIVYFGFFRGACPCMISSLQELILWILQKSVVWYSLVWIVTLLFAAFFFGKIWCGWLCHLGALQEFLHRPLKMKFLSTERAQRRLKTVQISVFILLVAQLVFTKSNLFCHYDPFKVAYNLTSPNMIGYVLLVILLVSSLFIERPFCRMFCPVGLLMGWISRIPWARKLVKGESCVNCVTCSHQCPSKAMLHENKLTTLHTQDCLLCGECLSSCRKNALHISRK